MDEKGYQVLGMPDKLQVPLNLLAKEEKETPSVLKIKTSTDAELLLGHETVLYNKKKTNENSETLKFGKHVTRVEVYINKVKFTAIVDSGAPMDVISSSLAKRIKLAPEIPCKKTYGTACHTLILLLELTQPYL